MSEKKSRNLFTHNNHTTSPTTKACNHATKNQATCPPKKNHATSTQKVMQALDKENHTTSPQKNHATSPQKKSRNLQKNKSINLS